MTRLTHSHSPIKHCRHSRKFTTMACVMASAVLLVACGKKEGGSTQVAAKVNKEEISVHQVNFLLQRQSGLKPDQVAAASKRALEGLIDQELMLQQAHEQKVDRDPRVVMAVEAAKRDVIARAYAEKIAEGAAKPSDSEIHEYYVSKPALFSQRKIYSLVEFTVEADSAQQDSAAPRLESAKTPDDAANFLRASGLRYNSRRVVQPAESLPLSVLDRLAALGDGQRILQRSSNGLSLVYVTGTRAAPVSEEQAKPAIAAYLLNINKRKLVETSLKGLRSAGKIEYLGQFAGGGAASPAPAAPASQPEAPLAPTPAEPASPALDDSALKKGLSGLK